MQKIFSKLKFWKNQTHGNIAISAGLMMSVLAGAGGFATHHALLVSAKQELQSAADRAAVIAAKQLTIGPTDSRSSSSDILTQIAASVVASDYTGNGTVKTQAQRIDDSTVKVALKLDITTPFSDLIPALTKPLSATASAQVFGSTNICVIALEDTSDTGINLENEVVIDAQNCAVYSNSNSPSAVALKQSTKIVADLTCAVGGVLEEGGTVEGTALDGCLAAPDPIADRNLWKHVPTDCDYDEFLYITDVRSLPPGKYCEQVVIAENAVVTLEDPVNTGNTDNRYFFEEPLVVQGDAELKGSGALVITGMNASIQFIRDAIVNIEAPETGEFAGILIGFEPCLDRSCGERTLNIESPNVKSLLGTIYLPTDRLVINTHVDASSPEPEISPEAAFTIVVAKLIQGQSNPTLKLNTDYGATDVPVPDGFQGNSGVRIVD